MKALLLLNFIVPGVMLLSAFLLKKMKTPYPGSHGTQKWKIDFSGYNTPRARKSQAHWDYAQCVAPEIFLRKAKIGLWIALACVIFGILFAWWLGLILGYVLSFGCMIEAFMKTENELKTQFLE